MEISFNGVSNVVSCYCLHNNTFALCDKVLRVATETALNSLFLTEESSSVFQFSEHSYNLYVSVLFRYVIKPIFFYVLMAAFHTLIPE